MTIKLVSFALAALNVKPLIAEVNLLKKLFSLLIIFIFWTTDAVIILFLKALLIRAKLPIVFLKKLFLPLILAFNAKLPIVFLKKLEVLIANAFKLKLAIGNFENLSRVDALKNTWKLLIGYTALIVIAVFKVKASAKT